jgi:hypothetical protein
MIRQGSSDPQRITSAETALRRKAGGIKPTFQREGWSLMKTLTFWFRPAILVLFWVVLAAFTLAELATVAPLLRGEHSRFRQARHAVQVSSARR